MDASIISGLAALAGAAIGGLTSAAWFTQRTMAQAQWVSSQALRRQDLYRDFIEVAARSYIHALQHDNPDIPALVGLYADISRMRVVSSSEVIESASASRRRSSTLTRSPTKALASCAEWSKITPSTCSMISAKLAGKSRTLPLVESASIQSSIPLKRDGRKA
jgi:hypothetical protein